MTVRQATEADLETLQRLYGSLAAEIPPPDYVEFDLEQELQEVAEYVRDHVVLVAERDAAITGFVLARMKGARLGRISDIYVAPEARRSGTASELVRETVARMRAGGAEVVELDVQAWNEGARAVYERWGFRESLLRLAARADDLEQRLGNAKRAPSVGRIYVQTDDESMVERAVRSFLPRLGRSPRTEIGSPRNGWIEVDDELCSGDPELLRRLAREVSYRTGGVVLSLGVEEGAVVRYVLLERGSIADEYASVPEYYGPLAPGDVVALGANPTVAQRLTGADPQRLRAVARTAPSPQGLPAPEELYAQLAAVLGVE